MYHRCDTKTSLPVTDGQSVSEINRIVSLSPGITETLFALDLGDRVVGVTRFCRYPSEAQEKADVGGFVDPNYEAITALRPDLVFVLEVHGDAVNYLDELDITHVTVRNEKVSDILDSILTIGKACGVESRAREMVDSIKDRMQSLSMKTHDLSKPTVLLSIGRLAGSGSLTEVYVAGQNTFYDELITCAGGTNAYHGHSIPYPVISAEGLLALNPDIIIDLVPTLDQLGLDESDIRKEWDNMAEIDAVINGRIHVVSNNYAVIPGPRFIVFLEDMAGFIHPGIAENTNNDDL